MAQKLTAKQFKIIKGLLQDAFEEALRESDYAYLLDKPPSEWSGPGWRTEKNFWDLAEEITRKASEKIQTELYKKEEPTFKEYPDMASCSDIPLEMCECPDPQPTPRMAKILEAYRESLTPAQIAFLTLLQQAEDFAKIIVTQEIMPVLNTYFMDGNTQIKMTFDFYLPDISGRFELILPAN